MNGTFYQILSVDVLASSEEILTAYQRERAKLSSAGDSSDPAIEEASSLLNDAYETLSDPNRRAAYDRQLGLPPATDNALAVTSRPLLQPASMTEYAPDAAAPQKTCANCGALNPRQVTMCIVCNSQIGRPCPKCGNTLALAQPVCDRCGTAVSEYDRQRFGESVAIQEHIQVERLEGEVRTRTLNQINAADARNTAVFWIVALLGCGALMFLAYYALQFFDSAY